MGDDRLAKITRIASDEECTVDGQLFLLASNGGIAGTAFLDALSVWVACQNIPPTVAAAAETFNATEDVIRLAVEHHYWLFLDGDTIEQEGL